MIDEQSPEDRPEHVTLAQAEAAFQFAMELIGQAQNELIEKARDGTLADTEDMRFALKHLGQTIRIAQTEREHVADIRRKNGELVEGDLDLEAARDAVCEQLDRIADSLKTE